MDDNKRTSITVVIPAEKRKKLNELAVKTGISVASIVRNLIYEKLEKSKAA